MNRYKKNNQFKYVIDAWQWWGDEIKHAEFEYTSNGKQELINWLFANIDMWWTVSVKKVRVK